MSECTVYGCEREARSAGLCHAHYVRKQRGRPLNTPIGVRSYTTAWERLEAAALHFADAEGDDDFRMAKARLIEAARNYRRLEAR